MQFVSNAEIKRNCRTFADSLFTILDMKKYIIFKGLTSFILSLFLFDVFSLNVAHATQVQTAASSTSLKYSSLNALLHASPLVQLVLLILVSLSILCWAIAWTKYRELKTLREANQAFSTVFWKATSLDELHEKISVYSSSSFARLFKDVFGEMKKIADSPLLNTSDETTPSAKLTGLDNLERTIRKSTENEMAALESKLTVLASTGSTGPFIGLFGTVWGIMTSFEGIARTGSASLATVAPGISEALIATAIGLAAAIPAVILYNHFISQVRREELELNNFGFDLLNILKRNFFKA